MSFTTKKIPQGTLLFKSGTRLNTISIVDSGCFKELQHVQAPECIGEEILFGSTVAMNNVLAIEDSSVIEVPVENVKNDLKKADPRLVMILKGLAERLRVSTNELKNLKPESEALPCPPNHIPKTFGMIYHAAIRCGVKNGDHYEVTMKQIEDYAVVLMGEASYRINGAIKILKNLDYLTVSGDKLVFTNMFFIETFIDYYRDYSFRSNGSLVLRTNEKIKNITLAVLDVSKSAEADRSGIVRLPYKETIDALKEILGKSFEADQLFSIEQKGLQIKKITSSDGGLLAFYRAEFEQMIHNWRFLREIEQWNEKGFI